MPDIHEGDILLYYRGGGLSKELIEAGEYLEDGAGHYYHCAIAINSQLKIEANGFEPVQECNIVYDGTFDVFRPPIPVSRIRESLAIVRQYRGQHYDWWLIIDEGLRDLSDNRIHLPERFIRSEERKKKICSTFVAAYFKQAQWGYLKRWPKPTPEDIGLLVMDYPVGVVA